MAGLVQKDHSMAGHAWTVAANEESDFVRAINGCLLFSLFPCSRESDNPQMEPGPLQLFTTGGWAVKSPVSLVGMEHPWQPADLTS